MSLSLASIIEDGPTAYAAWPKRDTDVADRRATIEILRSLLKTIHECQRIPLAFRDGLHLINKEFARDAHHHYIIKRGFSEYEADEGRVSE